MTEKGTNPLDDIEIELSVVKATKDMVYMDDGYGITENSKKYFAEHVNQMGKFTDFELSRKPLKIRDEVYDYTTMFADDCGNVMWLSGFSCGYNGESCEGSVELIRRALFIDLPTAEKLVYGNEKLRFERLGGVWLNTTGVDNW